MSRRTRAHQPWIHSGPVDSLLILGPALLSTAAVLLWRDSFDGGTGVPLWVWLVLVVGVDVAHVYSTLFRTYLDPAERARRPGLYTVIPLAGWLGGVLLYLVGARYFWSTLAYLAVYHFIRQQYGFLRIYSRRESDRSAWERRIDQAAIYLATLYPLVFWHTHLPRNFSWFVDGDFVRLPWPWLEPIARVACLAALTAFSAKEFYLGIKRGRWNLPRALLVLGTAASWYVGIVRLNGDLAFTVTNVLSHGIPYLALVWTYGRRDRGASQKAEKTETAWGARLLTRLPLFVLSLLLLAYLEEALWDGLIWRDHLAAFPGFEGLPRVLDSPTLAWLVPLLALPQITHYLLDGFVWKLRKPTETAWREKLFGAMNG